MAKKIVLADDERFIVLAYNAGLTRAGYVVDAAYDGAEALEHVRAQKPDLIMLDLIMPKLNGFEVIKKIKADAALAHIPIIVLSNLSQVADEKEALRLGAVEFLVKSNLSLHDLITRIKKHIGA